MVGPNGSGKSNVVDALAWVMGEQGAKTLRGGKMEDVIFAGAGDRKPLGRAEVTLTIDNSDGALPIDYREVSVTRRMFRDGASEYEINGSRARLMDIQELLSDSGIGREMHVIVGQGRLAQILESRPEGRRAFIEEAAGVLKHRRRKEKAQRKLVGMQANLDRLTDLTSELSRQLKPLARQAEAAKRAATVQATLREARLRVAGFELTEAEERLNTTAQQCAVEEEKFTELQTQVEHTREQVMELEQQLAQATAEADEAQQLWFDLSALSERIQATARIAADRANNLAISPYSGPDPDDLEAKAEAADAHHEELAEQVEVLTERLEAIQDEVEQRREEAAAADKEHLAQVRAIADRREGVVRLLAAEEAQRAAIQTAELEVERLSASAHTAQDAVKDAAAECQTLREQQVQLQAEAAAIAEQHEQAAQEAQAAETRLEEIRAQHTKLGQHVSRLEAKIETLSAQAPRPQAADKLADFTPLSAHIQASPGAERALSVALGDFADALIGDLPTDALTDLDAAVARTAIITPTAGEPWRLDVPGVRWLLDELELAPTVAAPITRLLADVALVETPVAARELVAREPRLRAVTAEGMLFGEGWAHLGTAAASGVEIAALIDAARTELDAATGELNELAGTFAGAKAAAEEARVIAAQATAKHREHTQQLHSMEQQLGRANKELERRSAEQARHAASLAEAEDRLSHSRAQLDETQDRLARVEDPGADHEPSTAARDEAAAALNQVTAMELEARLSLRSAQEKAEQARGRGEQLRRQAAAERQARARHEAAMARRKAQAQLARVVGELAHTLSERAATAGEQATARRAATADAKQTTTARLSRFRDQTNALQTQLARSQDQLHALQLKHEQAATRREEMHQRFTEQLGVPAAEILANFEPVGLFDAEAERARLRQAEKDLNALGKVNPLALEEYKALEQRYEFLSTQLADVEQARRDLTDVITDVDAKILQLFTDAWHDVEAEFPKVFATLFPGGEGRLVLTEPDSMLTTGIEVEARPPGKKVKRLTLLSGGEKSLTALAMLVAIFRARPSPFYVMDEVEAALDDVNLRRLINLFRELRQDSQLIVITHQKPTMDEANVLYGVTMRGDGVTRVISQRMNPTPQGSE